MTKIYSNLTIEIKTKTQKNFLYSFLDKMKKKTTNDNMSTWFSAQSKQDLRSLKTEYSVRKRWAFTIS